MASLNEPYKTVMHMKNPVNLQEALTEARRMESNYAADAEISTTEEENAIGGMLVYNPTIGVVTTGETDEEVTEGGFDAFMQGVQASIDAAEQENEAPEGINAFIGQLQPLTKTIAIMQKEIANLKQSQSKPVASPKTHEPEAKELLDKAQTRVFLLKLSKAVS